MRRTRVFIVQTGVCGNLGDAVIRRRVLTWFGAGDDVHVYVGKSTPGWIEELQLSPGHVVYPASQRGLWTRKLLTGWKRPVLVFDPGEVPLGKRHLLPEAKLLLIVLAVRLRGGRVVRPPRAAGVSAPLVKLLHRVSCQLSNIVLWRDERSLREMGVGRLVPDTAFGEPASGDNRDRPLLLVSMRGKRPFPSDEWFSGIQSYAKSAGLRIVSMSQVDEDEDRNASIINRFGGDSMFFPWARRSDLAQEREVRALYQQSALVVSDRLHVLILASKAGAVAVELADDPNEKARTHFATVGIHAVSLDTNKRTGESVARFLADSSGRGNEYAAAIESAASALDREIERARLLVGIDR